MTEYVFGSDRVAGIAQCADVGVCFQVELGCDVDCDVAVAVTVEIETEFDANQGICPLDMTEPAARAAGPRAGCPQ